MLHISGVALNKEICLGAEWKFDTSSSAISFSNFVICIADCCLWNCIALICKLYLKLNDKALTAIYVWLVVAISYLVMPWLLKLTRDYLAINLVNL